MSIHAADNAAKDWLPDWKEMLGGVFSHFGLPDGKTRKGSFVVKIADTASPITQGLKDFDLTDELYYQMQMMPDVSRWRPSNIKEPLGQWRGPAVTVRAASSIPSWVTATSAPIRTTRFATRISAG